MAFELPNMPNFTVQPPQIADPLQQYGKMLQMKALMGQQQMLPYQLEQEEQKAQQSKIQTAMLQQQQQSQAAMVKAWSDPSITSGVTGTSGDSQKMVGFEAGFDPNALIKKLVSAGVMPQQAIEQASSFLALSKNLSAKTKDDLANYKDAHAALSKILTPIPDMNIADATKALAQAKQSAMGIPGLDPGDQQLVQQATLEHLPAIINHLGFAQDVAEFHKAKAAETVEQQKVIPQGAAMSPDTQQQIQKDIAVATNPQIQAGKEAVAKAEGEARANIEAQIARGSSAALANVPPHLVPAATAAATKAGDDYAQAKSVADRIAEVMADARKGNKVAYQLLPQEGALQVTTSQGVHRINMAEIQNYGGGSLWDSIKAKAGKALTGESIPKNILDDMEQMQTLMSEGSRSKYLNTLATVNQNYGSTFKPVEMEGLKPTSNDFFSKFGGKAKQPGQP